VQHQPTITEIVSFILRHRKNNAFTTETPEELYECLQQAVVENCILVDSDFIGNILGVIVAKSFVSDSRLHIHAILCIHSSCMANMAKWLLKEAKRHNWTITATRRKRLIEYQDTEKLLTKIINYYG